MLFRGRMLLAGAGVCLVTSMARAQPPADPNSILTLQEENSSISANQPTDRFYTNGLLLGWTSPTEQVPGFLATIGHTIWGEGQQRWGVSLSQQIYTPADTNADPANPHDRPYAGYLTANISLYSDTDDRRQLLMLSLGLVGPAAGGEQIQNGFHDLIGQGHDRGWGSQISNTPAINLLHETTWRLPLGQLGGLETDALPAVTFAVGDVRDYAQVGATVRIGQGLDSDFGVARIRPGLNGGEAYTPTRPVAWYLFAGVDGQAVAYDLLLQSNPFRGGPHVDPKWDVGEMQVGGAVMAWGMRFTVSYVAQTTEFTGQRGGLHQFGSASVAFRF